MNRLLHAHHEFHDRRAQRVHTTCAVLQLMTTQPNEVWTWVVCEPKGAHNYDRYRLYVVLSLYCGMFVVWMLADRKTAWLAQLLTKAVGRRQRIWKRQLTAHSDRCSIQIANDWHALYEAVGTVRSPSRPHTSSDIPYLEALIETTKYALTYRGRFTHAVHAKQ